MSVIGSGIAYRQRADATLGDVARREQQRDEANRAIKMQRKSTTASLAGTGAALGFMAGGASAGAAAGGASAGTAAAQGAGCEQRRRD